MARLTKGLELIETKQPSSRTSEKSGVMGANQIRPCRNSQGPNADKSTYKLNFGDIRPLLEPISTEIGETRGRSTPTRRKVTSMKREE